MSVQAAHTVTVTGLSDVFVFVCASNATLLYTESHLNPQIIYFSLRSMFLMSV